MAQLALIQPESIPRAHEYRGAGYRHTPAEPIDLLCSLPEWRARRGEALDLGCGDGALARGIHERIANGPAAARAWLLFDVRAEAIEDTRDWAPRGIHVERHVCDATAEYWPAAHARPYLRRVVTNPPWSVLRCCGCGHQWPARDRGTNCSECGARGTDLAMLMVAQAMRQCRHADIWVLHNSDWHFHAERCRFFAFGVHPSHEFAGTDTLSGVRVAYDDPATTAVVKPHNRPSVWYHWVPRRRYRGQRVRYHAWPLEEI